MEGVKKVFLLPNYRKEVMPMALFNAMPAASLLMEVGFSELIQLAVLIATIIMLVKYDKRK